MAQRLCFHVSVLFILFIKYCTILREIDQGVARDYSTLLLGKWKNVAEKCCEKYITLYI